MTRSGLQVDDSDHSASFDGGSELLEIDLRRCMGIGAWMTALAPIVRPGREEDVGPSGIAWPEEEEARFPSRSDILDRIAFGFEVLHPRLNDQTGDLDGREFCRARFACMSGAELTSLVPACAKDIPTRCVEQQSMIRPARDSLRRQLTCGEGLRPSETVSVLVVADAQLSVRI